MICVRCEDTGWLELTGGTHWTYGNHAEPPRQVEATPERPIMKRCECRKRTPAEERQREVRTYE